MFGTSDTKINEDVKTNFKLLKREKIQGLRCELDKDDSEVKKHTFVLYKRNLIV